MTGASGGASAQKDSCSAGAPPDAMIHEGNKDCQSVFPPWIITHTASYAIPPVLFSLLDHLAEIARQPCTNQAGVASTEPVSLHPVIAVPLTEHGCKSPPCTLALARRWEYTRLHFMIKKATTRDATAPIPSSPSMQIEKHPRSASRHSSKSSSMTPLNFLERGAEKIRNDGSYVAKIRICSMHAVGRIVQIDERDKKFAEKYYVFLGEGGFFYVLLLQELKKVFGRHASWIAPTSHKRIFGVPTFLFDRPSCPSSLFA